MSVFAWVLIRSILAAANEARESEPLQENAVRKWQRETEHQRGISSENVREARTQNTPNNRRASLKLRVKATAKHGMEGRQALFMF